MPTPSPASVAAIERRVALAAPPERVWRALTDPAELAAWFGQAAELDLRVGGLGWFEWSDGGRFHARVERVDEPRAFAYRWARDRDTLVDAGPSTLVEFRLEPAPGGGTVLHLRESGFMDTDGRRENVHGWLDELADLAEALADEPWQAGVRRIYSLRSAPERVWAALATREQLDAWFGPTEGLEIRAGSSGWFAWPQHGRFAVRVEAVEPPTYLAWSWTPAGETPLERAAQVLLTEWLVRGRPDGGTDLHLLETGFTDPAEWRENSAGWDSDVLAGLRRVLGEGD
jgi:uncharacterized protein YndB with AHSA1/START domain